MSDFFRSQQNSETLFLIDFYRAIKVYCFSKRKIVISFHFLKNFIIQAYLIETLSVSPWQLELTGETVERHVSIQKFSNFIFRRSDIKCRIEHKYDWLCNQNHVVTQYLSCNIRLRRTALAFSFSLKQSSRVTFDQKIVYHRNIKAASGCVR